MTKRLSEQEIFELANRESFSDSGQDFSSTDKDELHVQHDLKSSDSSFAERENVGYRSNAQDRQEHVMLQRESSSLLADGQDMCDLELQPASAEKDSSVGENEDDEWIDVPCEMNACLWTLSQVQ